MSRVELMEVPMISQSRKTLLIFLLAILLVTALPACSANNSTSLNMMPLDQMPADVRAAPSVVQQAYQFAAANPDVMKHIPCYCGCRDIGHTSNYSCYVNRDGSFDNHALGYSLCVGITQDAMRLSKEGKTVSQIKAYVDTTYSKYGFSNMP